MADRGGWRVSVVIPSYNRADLLEETLTSILAQTAPVHEVIVIDDGSTDNTAQVIAGFGSRVRYRRIENSGAPIARNVGAAMATGNWLWFCDSDDLWRSGYLAQCRTLAAAEPRPKLIFGNFHLVVNGEWSGPAKFATAPKDFWASLVMIPAQGGAIIRQPLYREILSFQPIFHSTLMMSRDLFMRVGGYDRRFARTGSEDFEFILRCASHAPIGVVLKPLVGIRRHEDNFSGNHLRALLGEVDILRHAKASHPAAQDVKAEIDEQVRRRSLQALDEAFALNDYCAVARLAADMELSLPTRASLKVLLARLPARVRDPIISFARLKNHQKTVVQ